MTHDEAFLQAIIDSPDDDAPRLIYADWLDERGDPHGEFIRVQCALAGMDEYDPRRWDLKAREKELLEEQSREWLGLLADRVQTPIFRRGFLDCVITTGESFLAGGAEAFHGGPLPELQFVSARGMVAAILDRLSPYGPKRIAFGAGHRRNDPLHSTDVEVLASSPLLAALTSLTLDGDVGPEGVRRLTAAPGLSGLRRLAFHNCGMGAAGAEALAQCPALAGLIALEVTGGLLTAAAMQALAESRYLAGLRRLSLSWNRIDAEGAAALASNPRFAGLEQLNLSHNPLGQAGAEALARSPHLRRLTDLRLSNASVGAGGVRALFRSVLVQGLASLDLSRNHLLSAGAAVIAVAALPRLRQLDLTGNEIGDEGAKSLAAGRGLTELRVLRLGVNGIRVWGVKEITTSPHLAKLQTLDLHSNLLEDRGLQVLARWPGLAKLAVLDVHSNGIGDVGAAELASSSHLNGLREVRLYGNCLGPDGVAALRASPLGDSPRVELCLELLDALVQQPPLVVAP